MKFFYYVFLFFMSICSSFASGNLSKNILIKSDILGYSLQYRVYTPQGMSQDDKLPTIYVTDGQSYIDQGHMVTVLDELITSRKMVPIIAVFVDNRNPEDLRENRRNYQLLCNENYVKFYLFELIKTIEKNYPVSTDRIDRVIQGVSFGGFNAACFGLMAYDKFGGISMHSPANSKFLKLLQNEYEMSDTLPLKIFLSIGNKNDNSIQGVRFMKVLLKKNYDLTYRKNNEGHNWKNWKPLIDDALLTFFAK